MTKDKSSQEPKIEELSNDDLDQVAGGKAAGAFKKGTSTITGPTIKSLERVHEDE